MLKNKKGITLIALVVTIVVLLILAGISISLIVDKNGIIQVDNLRSNREFEINNQIIELIIGNCIVFFKKSQLNECLNQNIKSVNIISDENSCTRCKSLGNFKQNVDDLLKIEIHPFCKFSIDIIK